MTKAIVSSSQLRMKLLELPDVESETYSVMFHKNNKSMHISGVEILCECNGTSLHDVKYSSIHTLIKVLNLLTEQPITIAIDSANWLYIKEAIL